MGKLQLVLFTKIVLLLGLSQSLLAQDSASKLGEGKLGNFILDSESIVFIVWSALMTIGLTVYLISRAKKK